MGRPPLPKGATLRSRFESKYVPEPNSGCWIWLGPINKGGYGQIKEGGKGGRLMYAHRVAWQLYRCEPLRDGLEVCHICDMKWCVNPDHLFLGTHNDNMQDAKRKGRMHSPSPEQILRYRVRHEEKLHCPYGHPYDNSNTYYHQKRRNCRECVKMASRRYRAARQLSQQ